MGSLQGAYWAGNSTTRGTELGNSGGHAVRRAPAFLYSVYLVSDRGFNVRSNGVFLFAHVVAAPGSLAILGSGATGEGLFFLG